MLTPLYITCNYLVLIQLAQELRRDAEKYLKGDMDVMKAIELFTQAIEYDLKSAVLYIRRAHAYIRAGYLVPASSRHFYKEAFKDTEYVIALQPRRRAVRTNTHMYMLALKCTHNYML